MTAERPNQGRVEEVGTLYSPYDWIEPTIGNRRRGGFGEGRINKGSGEVGKWSFEFTSNRANLENGVWVMKRANKLDDLFNT